MTILSRSCMLAVILGVAAALESVPCNGNYKGQCVKLAGGGELPLIGFHTEVDNYAICNNSEHWNEWTCPQQQAANTTETWLRHGGAWIDTASIYKTQTSIGAAIRRSKVPRDQIYLSTKCPGAIGYESTMQCMDDNLQMLGLFADGPGYVDLLSMHYAGKVKDQCRFVRGTKDCNRAPVLTIANATKQERQETWRAMEDLKTKYGVVKNLGLATYSAADMDDILEVAKERLDVVIGWFTPYRHADDILAKCKKHGIVMAGWSLYHGRPELEEPAIKNAAAAHRVSERQVALRWMLQRGVAITTDTNAEEVEGDLAVLNFTLSDAEMSAINALNGKGGKLYGENLDEKVLV